LENPPVRTVLSWAISAGKIKLEIEFAEGLGDELEKFELEAELIKTEFEVKIEFEKLLEKLLETLETELSTELSESAKPLGLGIPGGLGLSGFILF